MKTGRMNRLVELHLRRETGQDSYGEETQDWTVCKIWAERRELRGTERFAAQQHIATLDARYFIHHRDDVTTQDRLVDAGQTYDIHAVLPIGRREGLELLTLQTEGRP